METKILRNVNGWEFIYSKTMGVTTISNDEYNFIRNWNTGTDAQMEINHIKALTDKGFVKYCTDEMGYSILNQGE